MRGKKHQNPPNETFKIIMISTSIFADSKIFGNHSSYFIIKVDMKESGDSKDQTFYVNSLNFPHILTRFLYNHYKGFLFSVLPIDDNILAIHSFSVDPKRSTFIPVQSLLSNLQNISLNFPFTISFVEDLTDKKKFNHDIVIIKQCIESKIRSVFETEKWFQVKDESNEKILINISKSYAISNMTIVTEINDNYFEDNYAKSINKNQTNQIAMNHMKNEISCFQSCKSHFQSANQIHKKLNDKSRIIVTITGTIKKKKMLFLSFSENEKTKKRFEAKPCFCFPNLSPLYIHQLKGRNDSLKEYWHYVHGILLKDDGLDALCSFDGVDDDAIFEYPEECLLSSRLIDIPIHNEDELREYKDYFIHFIHNHIQLTIK